MNKKGKLFFFLSTRLDTTRQYVVFYKTIEAGSSFALDFFLIYEK